MLVEGAPFGQVKLKCDEVGSRGRLGDRVLHLEPGVHLQEVERSRLVSEELDGAGADVTDRSGGGARRLEEPVAHAIDALHQR